MNKLNRLEEYLEKMFLYCQRETYKEQKRIFWNVAFGAADFFAAEHPELIEKTERIWKEKWNPKFEEETWEWRG